MQYLILNNFGLSQRPLPTAFHSSQIVLPNLINGSAR